MQVTSKLFVFYDNEVRAMTGYPLFHNDEDAKQIMQGLCVDGMIVGLSMLNVANKLYSAVKHTEVWWSYDINISEVIRKVGNLAKTVEDIDHMAQTNPIGEIVTSLQTMMHAYTGIYCYFGGGERGLIEQIYARLNFIEEKNMYGDRLQAQMLTMINDARKRKGLPELTSAAARVGS